MARVGLPGGVFYDDEADCVCFLFCFVFLFPLLFLSSAPLAPIFPYD